MSSFDKNGYQIVKSAISQETAKLFDIEFQLLRDNICVEKSIPLDSTVYAPDEQVHECFHYYAPYCFEALLKYLQPSIEDITGKQLYPTYSYARIYYNGATMPRHTDRASCEYSATITISVDKTGPWEIYIKDRAGVENPLTLNVGDMCVYKGDELEHWREDPYRGNRQIQAFLHYVDANGKFSDFIYDKRSILGSRKGSKK